MKTLPYVRTAALITLLTQLSTPSLAAQGRAPRAPQAPACPVAPRPGMRVFMNGESMADRPYLGVVLRNSDGPADTLGLLIDSVEDDTPAARAGIRDGDRIVRIDDVDLRLDPRDIGNSAAERLPESRLRRQIERKKAGDVVTLEVLSNGRRDTKRVTLGDSPMARTIRTMSSGRRVLGVSFSQRGSMRDTAGLLITEVTSGGAADKAGLMEGDRVISIDGVDLRVPAVDAGSAEGSEARIARVRRALEAARDSQPVRLEVLSEGRRRTVSLVPTREQGWSFNGAQLENMARDLRDGLSGLTGRRMYFNGSEEEREGARERAEAVRERAQDARERAREQVEAARERAEGEREGMRARAEVQREMARVQRDVQRDVQREMQRAQRERVEFRDDDDRDDRDDRPAIAYRADAPSRSAMRGRTDGATMVLGGLSLAAVDRDFAQQFGQGSEGGALVVRSRGEWAPLRAGDVILSIDGRSVRDGNGLDVTFERGREQRLEILRDGRKQVITLPAVR
ncbi:MAG TPA: PDZ domain-containing protein [Gemmatimonadaceae bacterium]|nr:PDZ domain-containing protein [Gemmatimonadaceae bacterium]